VLGFGSSTQLRRPPDNFLFGLVLTHRRRCVRVGNRSFGLAMSILDDSLGHGLRSRLGTLCSNIQRMNSILELLHPNGDPIDKFVDVGRVVPAPALTKLSVSQYFDRKFHVTLCWTSERFFPQVIELLTFAAAKRLSAEQTPLL
jgi:hypothetical protein